jgi:alkaline phosphatase
MRRRVERDWEDDSGMPEAAIAALGCEDIATQLISHRDTVERALRGRCERRYRGGHGRRASTLSCPAAPGGSREGRTANLVRRWQSVYPHGSYAETKDDRCRRKRRLRHCWALFANSHMGYALQRATAGNTQPSLVAMTEKAIELLAGGDGYFLLVVEAGRIDHAHHAGNAANALNETVETVQTRWRRRWRRSI